MLRGFHNSTDFEKTASVLTQNARHLRCKSRKKAALASGIIARLAAAF